MTLLAACSHVAPIEVDDTRKGEVEEEADAILAEACEILDLECVVSLDSGEGYPLRIILTGPERNEPVAGRALDMIGCKRIAWSVARPEIVAHELGHLLGLDHEDDQDNLMFPGPQIGTELTDKQRRTMLRNLERINACP